jgi:EEF1A lysine methyltransferase 2
METKSKAREHWDNVYQKTETEKLGWFEENPEKSIQLLLKAGLKKNDAIIDVGCGTSFFIDHLIELGYNNFVATDISEAATNQLKERLQKIESASVNYIVEDICNPNQLLDLKNIKLWHDRAVLHFLTTEEQRKCYLRVLKKTLQVNGYAIISTFHTSGAKKCSGLDVSQYDEKTLAEYLGDKFDLIESFQYQYIQPSGAPRQFVYTLFKRTN